MKKTFIFLVILLFFSNISGFSQDISTNGEIYNYDLGDIFHYVNQGGSGYEGYLITMNDSIVEKYYTENFDTLIYKVYRNSREISSWDPYYSYDTIIHTIVVTKLDSLILDGNIDTVYTLPNLYNGRVMNNTHYSVYGTHYSEKYVEGCGRVYQNTTFDEFNAEYNFWLKYYKKGEEEWGIPEIILNTEEISHDKLAIYPNPAKNEFFIDLNDYKNVFKTIEVYSSNGKLVKSQLIDNSTIQKINIDNFNKGLYIVKLASEIELHQFKLIKN